MSSQCCHFSCQPTPSKLTTMNCGGFSPGCSFLGTKPSDSATPSWGAAFGSAGAALLAAAGDGLGLGVAESDGLGEPAGSELGAADEVGAAATKLVTVSSAAWPLVPHAVSKAMPTSATVNLRPRRNRIQSSVNDLVRVAWA